MVSADARRVRVSRAPSTGCVQLVEQGCDRTGQLGAAGGLGQQAGELFGAAQIIHGLREAETEPKLGQLGDGAGKSSVGNLGL